MRFKKTGFSHPELVVIDIGIPILLGIPKGESPEKKAGRLGERFATCVITEILKIETIQKLLQGF